MNKPLVVSDNDIVSQCRSVNKPGEYAILPQNNRCSSFLPHWENTYADVLTSPERGANFVQMELVIEPGGGSTQFVNSGLEHFLYVVYGNNLLTFSDRKTHIFDQSSYVWLPPNEAFSLKNIGDSNSRIIWLRKRYIRVDGFSIPERVMGIVDDLPFRTMDTHLERLLIPYDLNKAFDLSLKILYFEPGNYFSFVESHVQEHGLVMLEGTALYYINGNFHEVEAGDFIYMSPWCLQFMYATGWKRSSYLLYKDFNRDYISGL
ncbi:MAG: (S)-ureidoglycine aminohydrolase [Candidatus Bathyarchaeia archaeon]